MNGHPDCIDELNHVAVIDDEIVGSIRYTKSHVTDENDERVETVTFGPLCVHPDHQRVGIGTRLIEHTKELVIQKKYPAIIIFGDPHNYCKHGFRNGKDCRISTMDGKHPLGLLVLELQKGIFDNHDWRFEESKVYEIDEDEAIAYDRSLPYKEKSTAYSQELFSMLIRSFVE
jgi:predicted N-acetyltransferase YhbS